MTDILPHWLKELYSTNLDNSKEYEEYADSEYKLINANRLNPNKRGIAYLKDGPFLPAFSGAAVSIMGMFNALLQTKYQPILIKCWRPHDSVSLHKELDFPTIFVSPRIYYKNYRNKLKRLIKFYNIHLVQTGSAEAINIQSKFLPEGTEFLFEVHNVESSLIGQLSGSKNIDLLKYMENQEIQAINSADVLLFRSNNDYERYKKVVGRNRIKIGENAFIYIGGVDSETVSYEPDRVKRYNKIIFLGNMGYSPNLEALRLIEKYISPYIDEIIKIVGKIDMKIIEKSKNKNIIYYNWIENLDDAFSDVGIAIAPIVSGTGTRLKILDYALAGIPIIATSKAIEGYPFPLNDKVIVEDDIKKYPKIIKKLISSEKYYDTKKTHEYVVKHYSWRNCINVITDIYDQVASI